MSVLVWAMMAIAVWHATPMLPDRWWGGIVGAFLLILAGGLVSGWLLSGARVPLDNPPGLMQAVYALPGSFAALAVSYAIGVRHEAGGV